MAYNAYDWIDDDFYTEASDNLPDKSGKFSPIHEVIQDALNLDLANPGYNISIKEESLKNSAIRLGCMDYYRAFPLKVVLASKYSMSGGHLVIPFKRFFDMGNPKIPEEQQKYAHFLGIIRHNVPSWNQMSNPNNFDRQLLGVQVNPSQYDPLKSIAYETYEDWSHGQVSYQINRVNSTVDAIMPFGLGQIIWTAGIGFSSPEYVEMTKVDYLCKFISCRFIESIIQARTGVKLSADMEISTEALNKRLDWLREQVKDIQIKSKSHILQWS